VSDRQGGAHNNLNLKCKCLYLIEDLKFRHLYLHFDIARVDVVISTSIVYFCLILYLYYLVLNRLMIGNGGSSGPYRYLTKPGGRSVCRTRGYPASAAPPFAHLARWGPMTGAPRATRVV
jgi:hypothetical protein